MKFKIFPEGDLKENWMWYIKLGFFIALLVFIILWFVENL